jgi:hypothetical protein
MSGRFFIDTKIFVYSYDTKLDARPRANVGSPVTKVILSIVQTVAPLTALRSNSN